jgi:1-deoxy-D-xylulose-5-phosphate reductoisomerase
LRRRVSRLILTASGGPFRTWDKASHGLATPEQAVAHPNWSMGAKISVDSATMMNKGLEMIEASYLFDTPQERIDVVIHPQSVIHSLVEYADGSTLAQLGPPDMRARSPAPSPGPTACLARQALDLAAYGQLTFEAPDLERFPSIAIAREALRLGGGAPAAMNAANEVAVAAFLDRQIGFLDIAAAVAGTLERMNSLGTSTKLPATPLDSAMMTDASARRIAAEVVAQKRQRN